MGELYNSRTGLEEHPLALDAVRCVQLVRSFTRVPIRINSTYRNYIPTDGIKPASTSPHMLGQAIDFSFLTSEEEAESLYVAIRDDFDRKGPLFQALWEEGCRGFGSYDTFIHLDTVRSELYEPFRAKRGATYQGALYARWNNMKTLLYRKADIEIAPSGELQETGKADHPVVAEVKHIAGTVSGMISEIFHNEDQGRDFNLLHAAYLAIVIILLLLGLLSGALFIRKSLGK